MDSRLVSLKGYPWPHPADLCSSVRARGDSAADVEAKDKEGETALISAARSGHEAVVRLLLRLNDTGLDLAFLLKMTVIGLSETVLGRGHPHDLTS